MMEKEKLHFAGTDWLLSADDVSAELREALEDCGQPGDTQEAVNYVLSAFDVTGDPEACKAYLRRYGAWDADELADHDHNLERLVWLAGCGLAESGEAYFSSCG